MAKLARPRAVASMLRPRSIAIIGATERAVDAAAGLVTWGEALRRHRARPAVALRPAIPLRAAGAAPSRLVRSMEAARWLAAAGVRLVETRLAATAEAAASVAAGIGFPVAVKIESPAIPHRTEADALRLGLSSPEAVARAFAEVTAAARRFARDAPIDGVLVQAMARPGTELVLGLRLDPVFGHVVMAGLGGIFVEVLRDVAFARAPLDGADALAMLDTLGGRAILDGARGRPPVDRRALASAIVALGELAVAHPEVTEVDLNPVIAGPDGIFAVDWLVIAETSAP